MELKDFVSSTLIQLIDGILDAQKNAKEKGAVVNPEEMFHSDFNKLSRTKSHRLLQVVEFDIALTIAEDKQLKGTAGAVVAVLGLGYQAQTGDQKSTVSRIQFSVPVILPTQDE